MGGRGDIRKRGDVSIVRLGVIGLSSIYLSAPYVPVINFSMGVINFYDHLPYLFVNLLISGLIRILNIYFFSWGLVHGAIYIVAYFHYFLFYCCAFSSFAFSFSFYFSCFSFFSFLITFSCSRCYLFSLRSFLFSGSYFSLLFCFVVCILVFFFGFFILFLSFYRSVAFFSHLLIFLYVCFPIFQLPKYEALYIYISWYMPFRYLYPDS